MIKNRYLPAVTDNRNRWWELAPGCVAAYQPIKCDSLQNSYINLANPGTFTCTAISAPVINPQFGWIFTADALATGIAMSNYGTSMTGIVRYSNLTVSGEKYLFGSASSATGETFHICPDRGSSNITYGHDETVSIGPQLSGGVLAVTQDGGYRNGTLEVAGTSVFDSFATFPLFNLAIGSRYWGNNEYSSTRITCYIQAIAFYSGSLSASLIMSLTAAMNAL